jgi:hypothetical protein
MNNTNANEELSCMVDQFKEIALKVGNKNCVMTTQIAELQRKMDALARIRRNTKSIIKPSIKARIGATSKAYGKKGTGAHNS